MAQWETKWQELCTNPTYAIVTYFPGGAIAFRDDNGQRARVRGRETMDN